MVCLFFVPHSLPQMPLFFILVVELVKLISAQRAELFLRGAGRHTGGFGLSHLGGRFGVAFSAGCLEPALFYKKTYEFRIYAIKVI